MILFTYRLSGAGWAVATIANERSAMSIPASYLCDALGDFVDAVQSLFDSNYAECLWEEEPGIVRWEFRRDGSRVILKVGWDQTEGEHLVGEDDWLHFSEEVDRELDRLLVEWGEERYFEEWEYRFPKEGHYKLKQGIKQERGRRQAMR